MYSKGGVLKGLKEIKCINPSELQSDLYIQIRCLSMLQF